MKLNRHKLFLVYLFWGLLFPNFYSIFDTRGAILVNASLMLMPIIYLIISQKTTLRFQSESHLSFNNYIIVPLYFIFAIPFGMILGIWLLGNNLVIRDFFEFHRPIYWLIIFSTGYFYFVKTFNETIIRRTIISIFLICAIMGICQFLTVNFAFFNLYIKQENYFALRIAAPFPNPYDYGFVMIFMSLYFMCLFLNTSKPFYLFLIILSGVLIALTQSRSMVLSFVLANILLLPLFASFVFGSVFRGRLSRADLLIILIPLLLVTIGVIAILNFQADLRYLVRGFMKIAANPLYNGVTGSRVDQMSYIFSTITQNPILVLFGNGPAKGEYDSMESIYSYFVFRYGVLGLIVGFLFPALYSSYCSKIVAKTYSYRSNEYIFFRFLQIWFLVVPLISIANNHTEQIRVSFFYTLLLGLVAARMDALKRT